MRVLVTGGNGFIGSAVVRRIGECTDWDVVNLDNLSIGSSLEAVRLPNRRGRYVHEKVDIRNEPRVQEIFTHYCPDAVLHVAAESHVDRSIDSATIFIETNVVGTFNMLEAARRHVARLDDAKQERFRFLHVSTDEVYGSLGVEGKFTEATPYRPSSPYAASKAAADHLVHAWYRTYGLPTLVTNSSNNYGPFQYPEKLIPVLILSALEGRPLPLYGRGLNVRDWLYVEDHAEALLRVLQYGRPGESYNVGGNFERQNIEVARAITELLDEMMPQSAFRPHDQLIKFVADRPGHDIRYAVDGGKLARELNWIPRVSFEAGLRRTVAWYLRNWAWCEAVQQGARFHQRIGLAAG